MRKGYVTVFFTVAIALCMSLIIGLFYEIQDNAMRMKAVCAADTSMTSVFAEYNKALWDRFSLVFVDSAYGANTTGMALTEEHLKVCLNKNCEECKFGLIGGKDLLKLGCDEAKTKAVCLASDNNGRAVKQQAVNLMKYYYKIAYAEDVLDWVKTIEAYGLGNGADYSQAFQASEDISSKYDLDYSGWLPSVTGGNNISEDTVSPLGILALVTDISSISKTKIKKEDYASGRKLNKGNLPKDKGNDLTEAFFLREYFTKFCGNYRNVRDDSLLSYQLEYLCAGKNSDSDNLASIARRILVIREAANFYTLNNDAVKMGIIRGVCFVICLLAGVPEICDLLVMIIVACWANYESITDLKIIFKGGKIPLIKTSSQWITDIDSAMSGGLNEENHDTGLSYEDYLHIFMYLTGEKKLMSRFMSLVEMDIRKSGNNDCFRIDNCFDELIADIKISSDHGYDYSLLRRRKALN